MNVEDATRAVDAYIDRAVLAEMHEVQIVHGLGTGRVQQAVHAYLAKCGAVRHFKVSEWNPGATVVYL